jgi:antitoxin component YwqK of YwqJK toxin-antitoxin module
MESKWGFYFTIFGLLLLLYSCTAQKNLRRTTFCDCPEGLNNIDKNGRPEGYWKQTLPDSNGHFRIIYEGLYFRGRRVGAWKRTNWDGSKIYQQRIFMDTTEREVRELNYDTEGRIASVGMLKNIVLKDSIQIIDLKTNLLKWDTTTHRFVKEGSWQFFWPGGQLKAVGNFTNDRRTGRWNEYNIQGQLINTDDY